MKTKLLLNTQERNKKYIRKEVKKMKRIWILTTVVFFLAGGLNAFAATANPIISTSQNSTIHVEYIYNAYGVAISATEITTTTTRTVDDKGGWSETTTVQTAYSTWKGGSLKIDSASGTSDTKASDGSNSHTNFWTSYTYNANGQLAGASGGAHTTGDRGKDANGEPIGTFVSDTVDHYIIRNGQALRSSSVTTGTNYGPDGTKTSTFTETTNYAYQLIGGSWHLMGEVSTSTTNGIDGSTETITRTRTYSRDANGVCTGITQTATGTKTVVNENGGKTTYTMSNYQATFAYDSKVGWYLQKESYDWLSQEPDNREAHDPWTKGTLTMVDGHLALVVDLDDVKGKEFYQMDPSTLTGKTKTDKNGNLIFMLGVDDDATQAKLEALIGKEVNLMWQYFTKSSADNSGSYGWIWLAPVTDERVKYHLKNDKEQMVEQWGGDWDETKQYVVID